jgi:hypothetical protein
MKDFGCQQDIDSGNHSNECGLKSSICFKDDVLLNTGSSAQKIRFLIFKTVKLAETLSTPTTAQPDSSIHIENYESKESNVQIKCG